MTTLAAFHRSLGGEGECPIFEKGLARSFLKLYKTDKDLLAQKTSTKPTETN